MRDVEEVKETDFAFKAMMYLSPSSETAHIWTDEALRFPDRRPGDGLCRPKMWTGRYVGDWPKDDVCKKCLALADRAQPYTDD